MSQAPLCPVHQRPMRLGKAGTKWATVWGCSEFIGHDENGIPLDGANDGGYCNQKIGTPTGGTGRPAQRPQARPTSYSPGPSASPAPIAAPGANLRATALEAASRVFQGKGSGSAADVRIMAESFHQWLTDDGAGER